MGNAERYRAMADELLESAQRASDPELAEIYREFARLFQRLADWAERRFNNSGPGEFEPG